VQLRKTIDRSLEQALVPMRHFIPFFVYLRVPQPVVGREIDDLLSLFEERGNRFLGGGVREGCEDNVRPGDDPLHV